jgi:hypothetical protein
MISIYNNKNNALQFKEILVLSVISLVAWLAINAFHSENTLYHVTFFTWKNHCFSPRRITDGYFFLGKLLVILCT